MKQVIVVVLAGVTSLPAWSQGIFHGTIAIANRLAVAGIDAPVFEVDCQTRLAGLAYALRAYWGYTPDSLEPVGPVVNFLSDDRAGYFRPYTVNVPLRETTRVYIQLRAWEAYAGNSFEEAVAAGGKYGFSNIVLTDAEIPPGGGNGLLIGLQSFCLVPEPGTGPLLALGGAALLALAPRRRK